MIKSSFYSFINKKYVLIFGILFIFILPNFAQQETHKASAIGQWFQPNETPNLPTWKAHWIWTTETDSVDMLLARKTVELTELPEKAQLKITASSQYQLYINGNISIEAQLEVRHIINLSIY